MTCVWRMQDRKIYKQLNGRNHWDVLRQVNRIQSNQKVLKINNSKKINERDGDSIVKFMGKGLNSLY